MPFRSDPLNVWSKMMKLYSQKDVDKKALRGARIAVLGYGSQGRAHALNLKDSGFDVVVGVRKGGTGWKKAKKDGLEVAEPTAAARGADLVAMLVPDLAQKSLYESIESELKAGATLLFAHGFNIHFKQIKPRKDLDVVLIAPKGPGDLVRRQYQQGRGVPCLIAVAQDATGEAHAKALAFSASRPCSAAARPSSSSRASRPWSRPAISPRWPTTSACTS
jgi:ketol-acid reductoisomerase